MPAAWRWGSADSGSSLASWLGQHASGLISLPACLPACQPRPALAGCTFQAEQHSNATDKGDGLPKCMLPAPPARTPEEGVQGGREEAGHGPAAATLGRLDVGHVDLQGEGWVSGWVGGRCYESG